MGPEPRVGNGREGAIGSLFVRKRKKERAGRQKIREKRT